MSRRAAEGPSTTTTRPRGAIKPVSSRFRGGPSETSNIVGDGQDWERVMHTKLAQWRYMHLVALDELGSAERAAGAEISTLATKLEEHTTRLHALECLLTRARAHKAHEHFCERAQPALELLESGLNKAAPAHTDVCTALVTALRRLRTPAGAVGEPEKLPSALRAFRNAADNFVESARNANVPDAAAAAQALTQLEKVAVTMQQDALSNAAKQVAAAADAMDEERAKRATDIMVVKEKRVPNKKTSRVTSPPRTRRSATIANIRELNNVQKQTSTEKRRGNATFYHQSDSRRKASAAAAAPATVRDPRRNSTSLDGLNVRQNDDRRRSSGSTRE